MATPSPTTFESESRRVRLSLVLPRVVIVNRGGLTALGRYRPRAGYRGPDRFTFTATDVRGLRSAPSVVAVTVGG